MSAPDGVKMGASRQLQVRSKAVAQLFNFLGCLSPRPPTVILKGFYGWLVVE